MENENGTICMALISTVLHLRGRKTPQPLQDEWGNILLWNGEIFGGLAVSTCAQTSSRKGPSVLEV